MDEEKKSEEKKSETPAEDNGAGSKQETISELDRADQIAERMARENAKREELITREENLEARRRVGGRAEAGSAPVEQKEETPKEYHDRIKKEMASGKTDFN